MRLLVTLFAFLTTHFIFSQQLSTTVSEVENALNKKASMAEKSVVKNILLKNIGPSVMSGRVVDIEVNPNDPTEFYVAYASGGLWHTKTNGVSFTPILDNSPTQNLGEIAIDWTNNIIWAGTGENNSSRSSYAGIGILKSTNNGDTWENMGLKDSHHIGRIIINPNNPNEVVVGVTGHLYSKNQERGVYKTTDGGKSWKQTLFINDETGIIDLATASSNFNIQYAAAWQKDRKAWHFTGNGSASAIYKSTDGGSTWSLSSTQQSGFPTGEGVGRIGLAVFDEKTVYAVHDSQFRRTKKEKKKKASDQLEKEDFKTMSKETFLALDNKKLNAYLKNNGFQEKYRAENVKNMVRDNAVKPVDLAKYLENANAALFDTPVIGAEVYRSDDAGLTWKKMNQEYIDDLFYSYGYYFAQIRVDPSDKDNIYLAGVPLITSKDGGVTYNSISKENVHADHHALWINPKKPGHLINGNDGGVNISYDDGKKWTKNNAPTVGQFYAINVDNETPYNVYGGLQDNGVWKAPHTNEENNRWQQTGKNPWEMIMGGDGMQVQIDNRNSDIVYTGFQFGNYFRLNKNKTKRIQPKHKLGETPYRFNWQTPILLSSHNQDILYLGSHRLHRSLNQGDDWETISEDLTQGGKEGNVAYGTITTISESSFKFGLLYTGSDDGLVQVSKNAGGSWENIATSFPKNLWVSEVAASKHKKERVYATLNGYRNDDFKTYVYKSDNYGKTWVNISGNIPDSPVNAFVEDPENENLLFVGTDNGLYVSFNQGDSWELFQNGMPNVAVHDLVIQPEAKHLLIGTHGRSIYKADINVLQQMNSSLMNDDLHVFNVENVKHSKRWGSSRSSWGTPNTPGINTTFYTKKPGTFNAKVKTVNGVEVSATQIEATKGLNVLSYDVAFSKEGKSNFLKKRKMKLTESSNGKTYLPKGKYSIEISGNGAKESISFEIE